MISEHHWRFKSFGSTLPMLDYIILNFLEQTGCEHKVIKCFVGSGEDPLLVSYPLTVSLVDENDMTWVFERL